MQQINQELRDIRNAIKEEFPELVDIDIMRLAVQIQQNRLQRDLIQTFKTKLK